MDMGIRENSNIPWDIVQQQEDRKGVLGRHTPADVCMYVCTGTYLRRRVPVDKLTRNSQRSAYSKPSGWKCSH